MPAFSGSSGADKGDCWPCFQAPGALLLRVSKCHGLTVTTVATTRHFPNIAQNPEICMRKPKIYSFCFKQIYF